jgi:hypothetical protein
MSVAANQIGDLIRSRTWPPKRNRNWGPILQHAREVVASYTTPVTCKQAFYRLVADGTLRSTNADFVQFSSRTAALRRTGEFPDFIDQLHQVHQYQMWADVPAALSWLRTQYWRERTEGQPVSLYICVEKAGMIAQFEQWFGALGLPIIAISGWTGQGYIDTEIRPHVARHQRPAVLLYAGDYNPSGCAIERDFVERTRCWQQVQRVVLTRDQIEAFKLPHQPGKDGDTRNKGFREEHGGEVFSVDMDAVDPNILRELFQVAIDQFWDPDAYAKALKREKRDLVELNKFSRSTTR